MILVQDTVKLIEKMQLYDKRMGQWIFFNLWPRQLEFLNVIHNHRKVIVLKKRQTGMSQLTGADSLAQCMILENFTVLVLSKSGPDAEEYLKRVSGMYTSLPEDVSALSPCIKNGKTEMVFQNGSRIISLSANRGAGYTADRVIIDEAAFITKSESHINLETVLQRLEPTLDKAKGQLIIISTANGMNTFYEYWRKAVEKLSSFIAFFFSCWDDPTFARPDREHIIRDHGEDHANQEYPRTPREAFLSSGRPRFSVQKLQSYEQKVKQPIWIGFLMDDSEELITDDRGNFRVFQRKRERTQYMCVADVAEGIVNELNDPDYSCIKIFRIETLEQVAEYHSRKDPAVLGTIISRLGRWYNNALLVVERNNHGLSTLTQIRNVENYPDHLCFEHDLISTEKLDSEYKVPVPRLGWRTTKITRPLIINNLAKMILDESIPEFTKEDIQELFSFVIVNGKTQADEGSHDDRVLTLAIAYYLLNLEIYYIQYPIIKFESWKCCENCTNYFNEKGEEKAICNCTKGFFSRNNVCVLWEEFEPGDTSFEDMDTENRYQSRRN